MYFPVSLCGFVFQCVHCNALSYHHVLFNGGFFQPAFMTLTATVDLIFTLSCFCFILAQKKAALYIKFYPIH
jgi:hypothetical protein